MNCITSYDRCSRPLHCDSHGRRGDDNDAARIGTQRSSSRREASAAPAVIDQPSDPPLRPVALVHPGGVCSFRRRYPIAMPSRRSRRTHAADARGAPERASRGCDAGKRRSATLGSARRSLVCHRLAVQSRALTYSDGVLSSRHVAAGVASGRRRCHAGRVLSSCRYGRSR